MSEPKLTGLSDENKPLTAVHDSGERFNLSNWSLRHQALVLYFMLVLVVAGAPPAVQYQKKGAGGC